ncbi:fimbrial protein [Aquitalea denitrificans]|uniref:fimbrial protein n=1 Tax=Aquitalea denitrificans TaxID=519081 RepID=UPI00135BAC9E|nr:fimbrial protein [Aquitalea denitrificans]
MPDARCNTQHTNKLYRGLTKIGLLVGLIILPNLVHGACTRMGATGNIPLAISGVTAPARDAPLVTPLSPWNTYNNLTFFNCDTTKLTYFYAAGQSTGGNMIIVGYYTDPSDGNTYPINTFPFNTATGPTAGVGYIVGIGPDSSRTLPWGLGQIVIYDTTIPSSPSVYSFIKLRLVRYAQLPSNTIQTGSTGSFVFLWTSANASYSYPDPAKSPMAQTLFAAFGTTYTFPQGTGASCSVNTQNLQVNLPAIEAKQLSSVGATTGNTPFSLWVNCPSTTPVNVYMTLTDNSKPGQTNSTVVSAASGSSASGVGVQISDQYGLPITLGPDSSMAGNPGQFLVRSNLTGSLPIPFTASYIRTGTIKPGTLKAIATFTMSYQ